MDVDSSSRGSIINVNEKLVYTTGYSVSSKTIGDPLSGINSSSAIKIRRIV